jgi:hypothetical protein
VRKSDAAFAQTPGLLDALTRLGTEAGLLLLATTETDSEQLVARVRGRKLLVDGVNGGAVVAAVHRLLRETKILHDVEGAGL